MRKVDLIKSISKETGHSAETVRQILESVRAAILSAISRGDEAFVFGLGKLSVSRRPEKSARNIWTGEPVKVPPRTVPVFRASTALSEAAKGQ